MKPAQTSPLPEHLRPTTCSRFTVQIECSPQTCIDWDTFQSALNVFGNLWANQCSIGPAPRVTIIPEEVAP